MLTTKAEIEAVTKEQFIEALKRVRENLVNRTLPGKFNMRWVMEEKECGSVGCIGGWAEFYLGIGPAWAGAAMDRFCQNDKPLNTLFYHWGAPKTREQAVIAIDRYFAGEADPWAGAGY
jgi:hypothetical protein